MSADNVDILDGPLGLEAQHLIGGPTGDGVLLNVLPLSLRGPWPAYHKLTKISGLHDTADADTNSEPNTGRMGETHYPSLRRGKTITYAGVTIAPSMQTLRRAQTELRAAANRRDETTLQIVPFALYGDVGYYLNIVPQGITYDDEQTLSAQAMPSPYQRAFVLVVRAYDPRAYVLDDQATVRGNAGGQATLHLGGSAPTEPKFYIQGPTTGATITLSNTQTANGRTLTHKLYIRGLELTAEDELIVDFYKRTAMVNDDESAKGRIDYLGSDWWDEDAYGVVPGTNVLKVTGAGAWSAVTNIGCF